MRTRRLLTIFGLIAAAVGCEGVTETPAHPSGEDVIAAFAAAFAEEMKINGEPLPASIEDRSWHNIGSPIIGAAIEKYVKESRTGVTCRPPGQDFACPDGTKPLVLSFIRSSDDKIQVEASYRDELHYGVLFEAKVTAPGTGKWTIGQPEYTGTTDYFWPGMLDGVLPPGARKNTGEAERRP